MIKNVTVLGAGSAGLLVAFALKRKIPQLNVRVVRDPKLAVIGVGESTTPNVPTFLFEYLRLNPRQFYTRAKPTWKLGIHFLWGPRSHFEYGFTQQLDAKWSDLPKPNGYYCDEEFSFCDLCSSLMALNRAFCRSPQGGGPEILDSHAFHIYNPDFVKALEEFGTEDGIEYIDANVETAVTGPAGIEAIVLQDGRRLEADLFIDASGFRSELLGRALKEPFISYDKSLYCDKAVVGSWDRTDEPILPYTTVETMDAGWCWRIEHEHAINRGYVFCSAELSDDQARDEFLRKNPKAKTWDHAVKFRSGRYERSWVGNVIAVGNASGFVEPLEATALMVLCTSARNICEFLTHCDLEPGDCVRDLFNKIIGDSWDEIRNFLAIHYRFNTRLDTPFWQRCRSDVDVSNTDELLEFYRENGPTGLCRHTIRQVGQSIGIHSSFGIEGYLVILVGNRVPYRKLYTPTSEEWATWNGHRADFHRQASNSLTVEQSLAAIRHPAWQWHSETVR